MSEETRGIIGAIVIVAACALLITRCGDDEKLERDIELRRQYYEEKDSCSTLHARFRACKACDDNPYCQQSEFELRECRDTWSKLKSDCL